jgi:threonyl-tRNA synthetase
MQKHEFYIRVNENFQAIAAEEDERFYIVVSSVMTHCNILGSYQRSGGIWCLHLQGRILSS